MKIVLAFVPEILDADVAEGTTPHQDVPFEGIEILKVFPEGQPDVDEWVSAYVEDQADQHPDWKFMIDSIGLEI
jgi:hypothetical protein